MHALRPRLRSSVPAGPQHTHIKGPQGPRMLPRVTEPATRVRELVEERPFASGPGGADDRASTPRPPLAGRVRVSHVTAGSTHPLRGFVSPAATVVGPSGTAAYPYQGPAGPTNVATSDRTRNAGEGTRGRAPNRARPRLGRRPWLTPRPPLAGRVRVSRVTAGSTHPLRGFVSPAATVVGPSGTAAYPYQGPAGPTNVATSDRTRNAGEGTRGGAGRVRASHVTAGSTHPLRGFVSPAATLVAPSGGFAIRRSATSRTVPRPRSLTFDTPTTAPRCPW